MLNILLTSVQLIEPHNLENGGRDTDCRGVSLLLRKSVFGSNLIFINIPSGLSRLNEDLWLIGLNAVLKQIPASAGKTRAAVQPNQPFPIQTRKSCPYVL